MASAAGSSRPAASAAPLRLMTLGIDQPASAWPTAPRLKSYEAAGFDFVQLHLPPREVLGDPELVARHASALGAALELCGLDAVLHAPEELMAGEREADACLAGALAYASAVSASLVVYHGRRVRAGASGAAGRLAAERRSLARLARVAGDLGIALAIENLAPAYPGPALVGHDAGALAELVAALDHPAVGVCLDIGHANVVAGLTGVDVVEMIEPLLAQTLLVHLHDNFGAVAGGARSGALDPLRLDLHLAPGAGTVPWRALAPVLGAHGAPLQLEVRAPGRPEPGTLAVMVAELLSTDAAAV